MNKIELTFRIPSEARARKDTPFLEHDKFIKYCKANKVVASKELLEGYEKSGLLYPCIRVLYPRELVRRAFRANLRANSSSEQPNFKIKPEWASLIEMDNLMHKSHWIYKKELDAAVKNGHPLEQFLKKRTPFVLDPTKHRFKAWDRYKVIAGIEQGHKIIESRADHYYSNWKIFILDDLNGLNTDKHNRATGIKYGWGWIDKNPSQSYLNEFSSYFKIVASFAYRRALLLGNHWNNPDIPSDNSAILTNTCAHHAKKLCTAYQYAEWIRFLRKLIELHKRYQENEKILLSLQAESHVARIVIFLRFATNYEFERICDDVSGKLKGSFSIGHENGVYIYPGKLEEMFADEKWDLEQNVRRSFQNDLKRFNSSLVDGDQMPETLADALFNELLAEPTRTALAAIRNINYAYTNSNLWRDYKIWSGIRDLAVSVEDHGRDWIGGKSLDGVFKKLFSSHYGTSKRKSKSRTDASSVKEYLEKVEFLNASDDISSGRRCGKHLLISILTRNFASHRKGISVKELRTYLSTIYSSLVWTLFTIYAGHKGV